MSKWLFASDKKEKELRMKLDVVRDMMRKERTPFLVKREADLKKELDAITVHKSACRGIIRKVIETRTNEHRRAEER